MKNISRYTYRAKRVRDDSWVYGAYHKYIPYTPAPIVRPGDVEHKLKHVILTEGASDWNMPRDLIAVDVKENTVCQCIGRVDAHRRFIYEEDIVHYEGNMYVVLWDKEACRFGLDLVRDCKEPSILKELPKDTKDLVVIGNTFDNTNFILEALGS